MKVYRYLLLLCLILPAPSAAAVSSWVYDITHAQVTKSERADQVRPLASLTKIMTAIVAYEHNSNFDQPAKTTAGTRVSGPGTRGDLFVSMLVTSDNTAAELLARDYPGGRAAFIDTMNRRAQQLGMPHTRFVDASGLGAGNVGTAREVGVMIQAAAWYPVLGEISVQSRATVARRRHTVTLNNTNRELLQAFEHAVFGKTGFTTPAGRNVAMQLKYHGQDFVVVVMGASTRQQRYRMAHAMIQQHIQHIQRHTQEQLKK